MEELDIIADEIRAQMEQTSSARDLAYQRSRQLISLMCPLDSSCAS